jgi:hypothetical protein
MTPRNRSPRPREAGFVLIGVVIFVLALTIIGMSLFSLSSYEAQFLQRSLDGEQAFQSAMGGIERARFVLAFRQARLENVTVNPPPNTSALARQMQSGDTVSTGPVDWTATNPVFLRVTARVNQEQRTIEGQFKPRLTREVYSQLIATRDGIQVVAFAPDGSDRRNTVRLVGPIWEGIMPPDTTAWLSLIHPLFRPTDIVTDPVALPAVPQYLSSHSGPPSSPGTHANWWRYQLDAGVGNIGFFSTPSGDVHFSLYNSQMSNRPRVEVTGCAIWLMPRGIRFNRKVTVIGTSGPGTDCLIIVAGKSGTFPADPDAGIWFSGGLQSDIPVILISDGAVYIQDMTDPGYSFVPELTIYARNFVLTGPEAGLELWLTHPTGGALDTDWVPRLADGGYLPNVTSTSSRELTLIPGTWHASGR